MSPVRVEIPVFVMLREYPQEDGVLVPIEFHGKDLPFVPKRAFFIRNVPEGRERGNHAHKRCYQFIIPICGTIDAHIKNKYGSFELTLDSPRKGLLVPPLNWLTLTGFDKDTVCLVLASESYDVEDYLNVYEDFEKASSSIQ